MARHGKAVMAGYVPVRDGGFWRGGRVELRLGRLGSGTARRSRYVGVR